MKALLRTLACTICLLLSNNSFGAITLNFTGYVPILGPTDYTFEIVLPDFPATPTWVELSAPSCSTCYSTLLTPDARDGGWSQFDNAMVLIQIMEADGGYYRAAYYFAPGALGSFGTYETLAGAGAGQATLTISPVPEPASAYLLLMGAAGLAALRRRAKYAALKRAGDAAGRR